MMNRRIGAAAGVLSACLLLGVSGYRLLKIEGPPADVRAPAMIGRPAPAPPAVTSSAAAAMPVAIKPFRPPAVAPDGSVSLDRKLRAYGRRQAKLIEDVASLLGDEAPLGLLDRELDAAALTELESVVRDFTRRKTDVESRLGDAGMKRAEDAYASGRYEVRSRGKLGKVKGRDATDSECERRSPAPGPDEIVMARGATGADGVNEERVVRISPATDPEWRRLVTAHRLEIDALVSEARLVLQSFF